MNWLKSKRIKQALSYGWHDSKFVATETGKSRLYCYLKFLSCFRRHYVYSNQYTKNRLYLLPDDEKLVLAMKIGQENRRHDDWALDFYENRRFIKKWSSLKWDEKPEGIIKRINAYEMHFNTGKGLYVQQNVDIHREHFLWGSIKIGNNVLLAKHVFIDYTGEVVLSDNVKLSAGVIIESHRHEFVPGSKEQKAVPTRILIEDGVWVGQRAVICEECKRIGRYAQIGAGAVVRNPIPPYSIVVGNPAKIVGFLFTPEEVQEFESTRFEDNPTDMDKYEKEYNKFFISRIKDIKKQLSN